MTIPQHVSHCIDLHCHSTASDGALSPAALIARAAEKGVTHLALTDHDTLDGIAEARDAAQKANICLINGIELSCVWRKHTIHIVGLDMDLNDEAFRARVAAQQTNRWKRASRIAEKLLRHVNGCDEGVLARATSMAGGDVPGRPHFARVLVEDGLVRDSAQAFKKYLGSGKPGDVKAFWPELAEVVQWITDAGGIAVVAHPRKYKLTATRLRALVADFMAAGGEGIEVITSGQSSGDLGFLTELCRRESLLASRGSDFHFPGASWCELGRIPGLPEGLTPVWEQFQNVPA
ncbi:PHP domain-containing protein [Marinobacter zhanjiangensis]|uniref:Phosphatase n=1 Tax=Marinobacter zhanjiangensis TaxID=578215 RepID=A0ABQ3ASW2_9GAMM|nr:PHP domain-containing protein [Marinobacter zhanjiangensis]GGY64304.1 phosphatase [Marinobacter zhanjiangensis]